MYATLETVAATGTERRDATVTHLLAQVGLDRTVQFSLWPDPRPDGLLVEGEWAGTDVGAPVRAATLLTFDGPVPEEVRAAARYGAEHRVLPALATVPGLVAGYVLWDERDRTAYVLHLATSVEALDAAARAVTATELLPGEDPALLPGPDRVEVFQVRSS